MPLGTTADNRAAAPFDESDLSGVSSVEMMTCRKYNLALAQRLRYLADAEVCQEKLLSLASPTTYGNYEDYAKKTETKRFWHEAYTKTAKIVEDYPTPVTFDCIEKPDSEVYFSTTVRANEYPSPPPKRSKTSSSRSRSAKPTILAATATNTANPAESYSLPSIPSSSQGSSQISHATGSTSVFSPATKQMLTAARPPPIKANGSIARRLVDAMLDLAPMFYPQTGRSGGPTDESHKTTKEYMADEALLADSRIQSMMELRKIWGVGPKAAATMVLWGVTSIADLRANERVFSMLNRCQKIGLKHYEDINKKIPRSEVKAVLEYVQALTDEISGGRVSCTACGSYRRGANSSGDIDIILLPRSFDATEDRLALDVYDVVRRAMRERGFITDTLTWPNMFRENEGEVCVTDSMGWMGTCMLPKGHPQYSGINRRLDLKAYPRCQGAFATLYFTGSAFFNRSMRGFCKKAGLTLSDAGLAMTLRGEDGHKKSTRPSVICETERDIFDVLGIEWVDVTYRDIGCGIGWSASGGVEYRRKYWDEEARIEVAEDEQGGGEDDEEEDY
jgi:DNA polymerase/3'-5' exonuclease PolX